VPLGSSILALWTDVFYLKGHVCLLSWEVCWVAPWLNGLCSINLIPLAESSARVLAQSRNCGLERRNSFQIVGGWFYYLGKVATIVVLFILNGWQSHWRLFQLVDILEVLKIINLSLWGQWVDWFELGPICRLACAEFSSCVHHVWLGRNFYLAQKVKRDLRLGFAAPVQSMICSSLRNGVIPRLFARTVQFHNEPIIFLVNETLVWEHYLLVAAILAGLRFEFPWASITL